MKKKSAETLGGTMGTRNLWGRGARLTILSPAIGIYCLASSLAGMPESVKIESSHLEVEVALLGAELMSIRDAETGYEYLWQGAEDSWRRQAPILFPIVGQLKNRSYRYESEEYSMPFHGFAMRSRFALIKEIKDGLMFRLEDTEETRKVYPFPFRLDICYRIEGRSLEVTAEVVNRGKHGQVFGFGFHPGFNVSLPENGRPLTFLRLEATKPLVQLLKADDGRITDQRRFWGEGSVTIPLFSDYPEEGEAVVLETSSPLIISIHDEKVGHRITMETESPFFGIWRKIGEKSPFLCLEPWWSTTDPVGFYDDIRAKPRMQFLAPGEIFTAGMRIHFESTSITSTPWNDEQ